MPKVQTDALPASALFGVAKPSGPSSMAVVNDLKRLVSASRLFVDAKAAKENAEKLYVRGGEEGKGGKNEKGRGKRRGKGREVEAKMGQGGTLDPLADGVLVVGVNKGTKRLAEFLDCVKEYRATCLLGCETDSYDSEGAQVRAAPWRHVTRTQAEDALARFRGTIEQTPPIFSALKMDGKPLYEYARSGTPLPRPIARRNVSVHALELTHWIPGTEHAYDFPEKKFTDEERERLARALAGKEMPAGAKIADEPEPATVPVDGAVDTETGGRDKAHAEAEAVERPPAFVLSMRVSGGTYVRSLAHDVGHAVGSAAHVVTLTRSRQGRFVLGRDAPGATPVMLEGASTEAEATVPQGGSDEPAAAVPAQTVEEAPAGELSTESESADGTDIKAGKTTADVEKKSDVQCIPWEVFARAIEHGADEEPDADGWREWERIVMDRWELVEGKS